MLSMISEQFTNGLKFPYVLLILSFILFIYYFFSLYLRNLYYAFLSFSCWQKYLLGWKSKGLFLRRCWVMFLIILSQLKYLYRKDRGNYIFIFRFPYEPFQAHDPAREREKEIKQQLCWLGKNLRYLRSVGQARTKKPYVDWTYCFYDRKRIHQKFIKNLYFYGHLLIYKKF